MPEFLADRPDLADAGNRFRGPWLYAWILSPDQLRTNAHMPRVLDFHPAEERQRIAADIVAYVQSLRPPEATVDNTTINDAPDDGASGTIESPLDEDRVSRGLLLFENLGCIACHSFASPETEDEFDRLSLYYANAKYLPSAMQRFLLNPTAHYRWRPMPDFRLSPEEAQCLAAYVRSASKGQVDGADLEHGDRLRGEIAFSSAGCSACHSIAGKTLPNRTVAPRLPTVNAGRGCLSPTVNGRGKSPFWNLSTVERAELNRFIESDDGSLQRRNHSEAAERLVTSLRCTHCHARDDLTAYLPEILVDEGSRGTAPDILPSLTWAGEKLQGTWIVRQLRGGLAVRPRPWLNTRMPLFAAQAEVLAQGMTAAHGFSMAPRLGPAPDRIMVDIGRRLTRREEGFFCVECHAVGSQPAVGAFAHHGVNFSLVAHRINYDFYLRWITDPARVDPGTKMPTFSPDGTRTSKKLLDGDAPAQFTAIWHYLRQLAEDSNLPVPSAAKD